MHCPSYRYSIVIINNYWANLSKISWFVSGEQIKYKYLQITDLRDSDKSRYLTIIRRRRSEYWWIFPETKSRGIFTNIHEPEANNCFSIITQVIIEIPIKQRNVKFYHKSIVDKSSYHAARINVSRNAFLNSRSEEKKTFSLTFIPGKNKSKSDLSWSVLLSTMTTLHYSFLKQCFLIATACWASLQKFLKGKSDAYK